MVDLDDLIKCVSLKSRFLRHEANDLLKELKEEK